MEIITSQPSIILAAAEYSLIYLLAGGGVFGAVIIYAVAKMIGR